MTQYLVNETDFLPWYAAIEKLRPILSRIQHRPKFDYFRVTCSFVENLPDNPLM